MSTKEMVHVERSGHSARHIMGTWQTGADRIGTIRGGSCPAFLKEMLPRFAHLSGKQRGGWQGGAELALSFPGYHRGW